MISQYKNWHLSVLWIERNDVSAKAKRDVGEEFAQGITFTFNASMIVCSFTAASTQTASWRDTNWQESLRDRPESSRFTIFHFNTQLILQPEYKMIHLKPREDVVQRMRDRFEQIQWKGKDQPGVMAELDLNNLPNWLDRQQLEQSQEVLRDHSTR